MSALRQAMVLSLAFLILLSVGGVALDRYVTEEFRTETEAELREEFLRISAGLRRQGALPDSIDTREVFSDLGVGYAVERPDGEILGPVLPGVFDRAGFALLEDTVLFQPDALEALDWLFEVFEAQEDGEFEDLAQLHDSGPQSDLAFDVSFDAGADLGWRVFVGPVLDGRLIVYAPGVSAFGSDLTAVILVFVVALSLPGLVVGSVFGLRAQKRLSRMGAAFDRIADGDLSVRIAPARVRDDIDELALRIDDATEKLAASLRQMSEFSANIAHDLRTPLTRLRLHLEQGAEARDGAAHNAAALEQMDTIIAIFSAIQRIAKLKKRERRDEFVSLDLAHVAQQAFEVYEAVAQDGGQSLRLAVRNPAQIHGDPQLILQVLANLIENAIRHAGDGAKITMEVEGTTLRVCDDGPGVPLEERERILDPLYRLDRSRNTAGAGLGLAMVKAIADLHEAALSLSASSATTAADGPGLCVELRFQQGSGHTQARLRRPDTVALQRPKTKKALRSLRPKGFLWLRR